MSSVCPHHRGVVVPVRQLRALYMVTLLDFPSAGTARTSPEVSWLVARKSASHATIVDVPVPPAGACLPYSALAGQQIKRGSPWPRRRQSPSPHACSASGPPGRRISLFAGARWRILAKMTSSEAVGQAPRSSITHALGGRTYRGVTRAGNQVHERALAQLVMQG